MAVLAAQWSMPWLSGTLLEPAPRTGQLLAHLFLLHSVLDVGALTAGAWYVAMDFQLYGLLALLLWLGQRGGQQRWAMGLVLGMTAASLLWWNTQTELDDWALYFFGAYGLGAVARLRHRLRELHWRERARYGSWVWCCWPGWPCCWTFEPALRWRWRWRYCW
ncbi:MAG: hypothetical protein ACI9M6_001916 [Hydrogenophaga sp.]